MAERLIQITRPSARGRSGCDVCGAPIGTEHDHLVDVRARALLCACRACALLFAHDGAGGGRLRTIPQRYMELTGRLPGEAIESLDLPIGLAFFLRSGATGRVTAFYPSPAGAMESELPIDGWDGLVAAVPPLSTLSSDVEALLIRRRTDAIDAFIVPIDASYELVGLIRRAWRGAGGGDDVARDIDAFLARVRDKARAMAAA